MRPQPRPRTTHPAGPLESQVPLEVCSGRQEEVLGLWAWDGGVTETAACPWGELGWQQVLGLTLVPRSLKPGSHPRAQLLGLCTKPTYAYDSAAPLGPEGKSSPSQSLLQVDPFPGGRRRWSGQGLVTLLQLPFPTVMSCFGMECGVSKWM